MNELLEKLSSYNIFNYLFPGVVFAAAGTYITSSSLLINDIIIGAFVYYFYGLVISRIGSIVLEPLFRRTRIVRFAPYSDFVAASKNDDKLELLSEQNNMYLTLTSTFFCLLVLCLFDFCVQHRLFLSSSPLLPAFAVFLLFLLFTFSYRKQSAYLVSRIRLLADKESEASPNNRKNETDYS